MMDQRHRQIDYMRISLTDQCNFRCVYCMPKGQLASPNPSDLLTDEEWIQVVKSAAVLGISKVKLTGGEPLLRKNLANLVREIKKVEGIQDISLTTNGMLLKDRLGELIEAGITSINISLDTLNPQRFQTLTGVDGLAKVKEAIEVASRSPLKTLKINVLAMKGLEKVEILSLVGLAKDSPIHVRFIELMPIGQGKDFQAISKNDIGKCIQKTYGNMVPYDKTLGNGPATYWQIPGFKGKIGFISAVSECFCETCNRIRFTCDGYLKLCIHSKEGLDVRGLLRSGVTGQELAGKMGQAIGKKPKAHLFGDDNAEDREDKMMAQIGG